MGDDTGGATLVGGGETGEEDGTMLVAVCGGAGGEEGAEGEPSQVKGSGPVHMILCELGLLMKHRRITCQGWCSSAGSGIC